jgi:hypothetical protein
MTSTTKQRVTLFLEPALIKQARAQAIVEDTTLTTLVEKALSIYLPVEIIIKKANKELIPVKEA